MQAFLFFCVTIKNYLFHSSKLYPSLFLFWGPWTPIIKSIVEWWEMSILSFLSFEFYRVWKVLGWWGKLFCCPFVFTCKVNFDSKKIILLKLLFCYGQSELSSYWFQLNDALILLVSWFTEKVGLGLNRTEREQKKREKIWVCGSESKTVWITEWDYIISYI